MYPGVEQLAHMEVLFLVFVRTLHIDFHNGCTNFHSHAVYRFLSLKGQPLLLCLFVCFLSHWSGIETHWSFKSLTMSLNFLIGVVCVSVSLCVYVCPCQCASTCPCMHMQRPEQNISVFLHSFQWPCNRISLIRKITISA